MCVGQYTDLLVCVFVVVTTFYTMVCILSFIFRSVALQIVICPPPFRQGGYAAHYETVTINLPNKNPPPPMFAGLRKNNYLHPVGAGAEARPYEFLSVDRRRSGDPPPAENAPNN